ncbi:MAG: nucleoside hydrolase [Alphaproteobacteria bacterium]|nr:nucleoside hydrolase [Alphaproteobacteria bacterium]
MPPRRLIIDTDPGIDDAIAILLALASPELAVDAVVAVAGNRPLAVTAANARAVCELAGRANIAVYAGCDGPLQRLAVTAEHVHGDTGLGTFAAAAPTMALRPGHGVDATVALLRAAAPNSIVWCALGPLTNVAAALVGAPDIAVGVAELVLMGGASRALGNVTPAAEFNIHADPHAAQLVFESGLPITVVPLDVTHQVRATPERMALLTARSTPVAAAVAQLLAPGPDGEPRALHDPCVIAHLLAPELFAASRVNVAVECDSALTLGMTVIDWRGVSGRTPNANVLHEVDADGFFYLLASRLADLY